MRRRSGSKRDVWLLAIAAFILSGHPLSAAPGAHLSLSELEALASSAGFTGASISIAARIAMRESGGNPRASAIVTQPKPGFTFERSFGLWQVNVLAHPQYSEAQLLQPAYAARAAFEISKGGTDWSAWGGPI